MSSMMFMAAGVALGYDVPSDLVAVVFLIPAIATWADVVRDDLRRQA